MDDKQYDVFISYSHEDKIVAEGVCGYLESNRIRCFIDYRDIPKGAIWPSAIPPAIRNSGLLLAIFSKSFNTSEQTDNEISIAANRKIPILVFRITDESFDGTKEYFLTKSNWIEAFPHPEMCFGELYRNICILLGIDVDVKESLDKNTISQNLTSTKDVFIEKGIKIWHEPNGDWEMATYYFNKAAKNGNTIGMYFLAKAYYEGKGMAQSWNEAIKWFVRAAEHGHIKSMEKLANIYRYGIGVERNSMRALEYYTKAASEGSGYAMKELGTIYHNGELGVQDEKRSEEFYEKAFEILYDKALGEDASDAQYILGNSYMDGEGVSQSNQQAIKMYTRSAKQNYANALNALGICYMSGIGVAVSKERGFEMICRAAELGLPQAMNNLAQDYLNGRGVEANKEKYYEWVRRSAECGNATAQCNIGFDYYVGEDGTQDLQQAQAWFEQAAKSGSLSALYMLGHMYKEQQITALESRATGFQYIRQAAMRGYVSAYHILGDMYENGLGTEKNMQEAVRWYQSFVDLYNTAKKLHQNFIVENEGAGVKTFNDINYYAEGIVFALERLEEFYLNGICVKQNHYIASQLHKTANQLRTEYLNQQNDNINDKDREDVLAKYSSSDTGPEQFSSESSLISHKEFLHEDVEKMFKDPRTDWELTGTPTVTHIDTLLSTLFSPLKNEIDFFKVNKSLVEMAEKNLCNGANFLNAYNNFMYGYHGYCQMKGIESLTTKALKPEECIPYCATETGQKYLSFVHNCFISMAEYIGVDSETLKENINNDDYILDIAERTSSEILQQLIISMVEVNIEEEGSRLFNESVFYKTIGHQDDEISKMVNVVINLLKEYQCLPFSFIQYTSKEVKQIFSN